MFSNRFVVLDMENANNDLKSICQLAYAVYQDGVCIEQWSSLINPECSFGYHQMKVHKITEDDVIHAPKFADITDQLNSLLTGADVFAYGFNDFHAIAKNMPMPESEWHNVGLIAQRIWPLPTKKSNLKAVCDYLYIYMENHHDALSDVLATGEIVLQALKEGFTIEDLKKFSCKKSTAIVVNNPYTDFN